MLGASNIIEIMLALVSTVISCVVSFTYTDRKLNEWRRQQLDAAVPTEVRQEAARHTTLHVV